MSLRSLIAPAGAAAGALDLLMAVSGSASAATGQFRYSYTTVDG
ncbi:hypothetical protein ACWD11_31120 [Streptomyces sp. NPDC002776]